MSKFRKQFRKVKSFLVQLYSLILLRYTRLNLFFLKQKIRKLAIDQAHIGCGNILIKGWLNIGLEKDIEYGRIIQKINSLYLNYDLRGEWPFEDNSLRYLTANHFIEHFDLNNGIQLVQKIYLALKKGGVLRMSCPDLEIYAKNYIQGNKVFFENKLIKEWCCFKTAVTPGEIFIAKAYDSGGSHKWFYDFDSLKHILTDAGFVEIQRKKRLEGNVPDLEIIELATREIETVYVEAVKY